MKVMLIKHFHVCIFQDLNGKIYLNILGSHTCYFTLDLPAYTTTDVMYDRLNYAITSCSSIDGDGMLNETTNLEQIDSDDDS